MWPESGYPEIALFPKHLPFYPSYYQVKGQVTAKSRKTKKAIAKRKAEKKDRKQARKRK